MTSLSSLSFYSTINNVSATSSSSSLFPLSRKPCQPSKHNIVGNRRDILIGLLLLAITTTYLANAAPLAPDLKNCGLPSLPNGAKPTKCCPPISTKVTDFEFPSNKTLRVRQAAHLVTDEYVAKYKKALQLMKALPPDDPRSFTQQAKIHCAYSHNSYHQVGYPNLDLQVHFSWIFLPFHRWYLYFYERILGSLINDDSFALPYWNWDNPPGMEIPAIYIDPKSPLYDPRRDANHQPPTLVDLNWNIKEGGTSGDIEANLCTMYNQIVSGAKESSLFFGKDFRAGMKPYTKETGMGTLEASPHNIVHVWSGDKTQPNREDLGSLYSAARDPLFYSHHANMDRMWEIWKSLGGNRKDIADPDWLESSFLFYDENKNLVNVKIKDSLDTRKLGYVFQPIDIPWLKSKPTPRRSKAQRLEQKPLTSKSVEFPLILDSIVSTVVKRPKKSRSKREKDEKEEVLVIQVQFDRRQTVKFDVLINEEEDEKFATPVNREFAGSFVIVTHTQTRESMVTDTNFRIGITDLLEDLEADDDDTVVIILVPQFGRGLVTIMDIKIDFLEAENISYPLGIISLPVWLNQITKI